MREIFKVRSAAGRIECSRRRPAGEVIDDDDDAVSVGEGRNAGVKDGRKKTAASVDDDDAGPD